MVKLIYILYGLSFFFFGSLVVNNYVNKPHVFKNNTPDFVVSIDGEITDKTYDKFKATLEDVEKTHKNIALNAVKLNSKGGGIKVSLAIGRLIRSKRLNTYVDVNDECASACVYILMAGIQRYPFGKVGVHSFFTVVNNLSDSVEKDLIDRDAKAMSDYIKLMGINPMMNDIEKQIPSWEMKFLNDTEKKEYGLLGFDKLEEEHQLNKISKLRGLSKLQTLSYVAEKYDDCMSTVKNFKFTLFECLENQ